MLPSSVWLARKQMYVLSRVRQDTNAEISSAWTHSSDCYSNVATRQWKTVCLLLIRFELVEFCSLTDHELYWMILIVLIRRHSSQQNDWEQYQCLHWFLFTRLGRYGKEGFGFDTTLWRHGRRGNFTFKQTLLYIWSQRSEHNCKFTPL